MNAIGRAIGSWLATYLGAPRHVHGACPPTPIDRLGTSLRPGDVLLVDGNSRVSTAIKYLTQSTWSHAALYVGCQPEGRLGAPDHCFVEADLAAGVRSVGLAEFAGSPTRICRPIGLTEADLAVLVDFAVARLGHSYDVRNVIDLARYLLPTPPVPLRYRRRMIALGSGDPTQAICSTLIAQAFQAIRYPVLADLAYRPAATVDCPHCVDEVLHIRHHSLFAPRDFDVSPYFQVVKPTVESGFDFRALRWQEEAAA
jgi:hypothetical protein